MNAALVLDIGEPGTVAEAVSPSLRDSSRMTFDVAADDDLRIDIEAEQLGTLRGGTNTALMLTRLATKMMEQG